MESKENVIEFITGEKMTTITFTNRKHINRIKKIYLDRKDEFEFYHENEDGSIYARLPLKWIRINPGSKPDKPKRIMSPEQKAKLLDALEKGRAAKKNIFS